MISYRLPGSRHYQERLYPDPKKLDPKLIDPPEVLTTYEQVIARFTRMSLGEDGIGIVEGSLHVDGADPHSGYKISFEPKPEFATQAEHFAKMHAAMLDERHAGLALAGADACLETPAWNPMAGFPVNAHDGVCEWLPCLPLGMPIANQKSVTLMHYPPIIAYRSANYLYNNTLHRWSQLLECVGIPPEQSTRYHSILDVNPIAAPGSGQSEYANDYFPINLASLFFDDEKRGLTYIRSMLELMLNPPDNARNPMTLPLLVCGSPLYDPQAAGWFRVRYKDQLPKDKNGSPMANVLQTGLIKLSPDSPKLTPYMVANHMIAAGVTGEWGGDPTKIPNIQKYEAQDLVAATFLTLCNEAASKGAKVDPAEAKKAACRRWFGADDGEGAANPPDPADKLVICALSQWDRCFNYKTAAPMFTYDQAVQRCQKAGGSNYDPCFGCNPLAAAS